MPRCEHCGFGHASSDRCVNCGSTDPFPRRRVYKLLILMLSLVLAAVAGYYFYGRALELNKAEERAKAVGSRFYDTGSEQKAERVELKAE
jgi:hypothetical protein